MIHLTGITKQYGTKVLYANASFQLNTGDKMGLVGPNGAGKTTIFRVIMKEESLDGGTISIPEHAVIGYFSQDVGEMRGRSVIQEVKTGAGRVSQLATELDLVEKTLQDTAENPIDDDAMAKLLEKYGEIQLEFEQRGGYDLHSRAQEILTGLGFPPKDHDRAVESYSGGWKMRIALAKILLLNPQVLLMDEPTNHLDIESILWLEEWLRNYKGALLMTSHDREFMNRIVSKIVEVSNKTITVYSGNYEYYMKEREVRRQQLEAEYKKQQDMLAKEEEFIARFAARASHAAQVQSRIKKLEKIDRVELQAEEKVMQFDFPPPPRSGNDVVKLANLAKSYTLETGEVRPVFSGITGVVRRLDKIAVVGVNGAGKSTLLKVICGDTPATSGVAQLGAGVKLGYFSQHALDVLNPNKTIYDEIHDRIPQATLGYVRNLLGAFLFSGDDIYKKISSLSGGEKSRVVLATILAEPVNFLVLDEPTNHLDIASRDMLLNAIKNFDGTVMLVSHDRHFLRQVTGRVFEVDHGALRVYEGDYDYYLSKRLA